MSIPDCLRVLSKRGATNVLVEGGPTILASFFRAGLVDEAQVFVAPMMIGEGPSVLADLSIGDLSEAFSPLTSSSRRVGDDVLHRLRYTRPPEN
jgi:diaminohydroxyphosphoribosylaminopyrimidine deaminase/5-amino-6-(5-phosphoribosylamino)uracil reductase